jgi:hypothetical protein
LFTNPLFHHFSCLKPFLSSTNTLKPFINIVLLLVGDREQIDDSEYETSHARKSNDNIHTTGVGDHSRSSSSSSSSSSSIGVCDSKSHEDHDISDQKGDHSRSSNKQKDQIDTSFVDIQLEQQLLQG